MAVDQKQEGPKGCADELLREVCEELAAVGCRASIGSMAPMEDLNGRIAAYLDKAKADATRAQFSAIDMADQGAKQFREGMAAGTALDQLARQIADNAVRHDIEIYAEFVSVDCVLFLDTTKPSRCSCDPLKALEYVRCAVEYIDQRGDAFDWHMQRHISAPHLVRFVDKLDSEVAAR